MSKLIRCTDTKQTSKKLIILADWLKHHKQPVDDREGVVETAVRHAVDTALYQLGDYLEEIMGADEALTNYWRGQADTPTTCTPSYGDVGDSIYLTHELPCSDRKIYNVGDDDTIHKGGTIPIGEYKIHEIGHGWLQLADAIEPPYDDAETVYTVYFGSTISLAGEELFLRERDMRLSHKRVFTNWCKENKQDPKLPLIKHIESGNLREDQLKSARAIFKQWSPENSLYNGSKLTV